MGKLCLKSAGFAVWCYILLRFVLFRRTKTSASSLLVEWGCLKRKCEALEAHPLLVETGAFRDFVPGANTSLRSTRFRFEEGALVTALRKGQWLVLDEVNLAPPDILQRLRGLLLTYHTGKQTFVLSEHTGEEIVPHENFRIFGCMNPPIQLNVVPEDAAGMKTDCGVSHQAEQYQPQLIVSAGKKDLPMDIRSCFAEFYVDEVWTLSDLTEIVSRLLPYADERFARQVAEFYIQARRLCLNYALTTGAGSVPHFSLRNLTRAVRYAVTASTRVWHPRKLLVSVTALWVIEPLLSVLASVVTTFCVSRFRRGLWQTDLLPIL